MDINKHLVEHLNHGPLRASSGGDGKVTVHVEFPTDEQGFTERGCHAVDCEPKLFKVRGDAPIGKSRRCPYCGESGDSCSFATDDQVRYAREKVQREAGEALHDAMHRMMRDAFQLDSRGRRKIGSGMFSMELSVTRHRETRPDVAPPKFERPRRDVKCGACGFEHVVFGLATWCYGCGKDIFGAHVATEMRDVGSLLQDCVTRRAEIGERLFARQAENVLEDLVSAWEAGFRFLVQRRLLSQGKTRSETGAFIQNTIRNKLQGLDRSAELIRLHLGVDVFAPSEASEVAKASVLFATRHPVTHCLGVTDPKLVAKTGRGQVGREVDLDPSALQWLTTFVERKLIEVWSTAFPASAGPVDQNSQPAKVSEKEPRQDAT